MKTAAVIFANGFEDIEAIAIVDVLRRAGIEVTTLGLGATEITSAHAITIKADLVLSDSAAEFDIVVLPGGMPGADNLRKSDLVLDLLKKTYSSGKHVAAICAAPMALEAAGLLNGVEVTCYPGFEEDASSATHTGVRVQVDGRIITGKGPGAAIEFALAIVRELGDPEMANTLNEGMIVG
ncbi:MAG: DJ-1/PfpI family protein [Lentisphaeria bacterium]|nr:DJ-1/PfpI family protein [Lentisphaeria bacterium]NQZ69231.1 DJ-1/PfpI family protein [Lentisphaeria bacterium]